MQLSQIPSSFRGGLHTWLVYPSHTDNTSNMSCYKEGFMQKQGKRKVQGYKRRWFVLNGKVMKYYASQELTENNLLGVIDMAMVVSAKQSKHGKNGFEITMPNRSYYMSTKTPEERDDWLGAIQNAIQESRKDVTSSSGLSNPAYAMGGGSSPAYSLVGDPSLVCSTAGDSTHTYTSVGGDSLQHRTTDSLRPPEYSLINDAVQQPTTDASSFYSEVGTLAQSNPSSVPMYDEIPRREPLCHTKEPESIYDVISVPSTTKKLPLNDEVENEAFHEVSGHLAPSMSSFMSKLSMESLDSIDSLELSDDETYDYDTDGEMHEGGGTTSAGDVHSIDEKSFLQPTGEQNYAAEKITEFFRTEGIHPSKDIDFAKLEKDYNLELDMQSEFPATYALKKFLITCK